MSSAEEQAVHASAEGIISKMLLNHQQLVGKGTVLSIHQRRWLQRRHRRLVGNMEAGYPTERLTRPEYPVLFPVKPKAVPCCVFKHVHVSSELCLNNLKNDSLHFLFYF